MPATELEGRLGERLSRALALTRAIEAADLDKKDTAHLFVMLENELNEALADMEATHD